MFKQLWSIPANLAHKCVGDALQTVILPERMGITREDWKEEAYFTDGEGTIYIELAATFEQTLHRTLVILLAQNADALSLEQLATNVRKAPIPDQQAELYRIMARGEQLPEALTTAEAESGTDSQKGIWAVKICSPRKTLAAILTPRHGHTTVYLPYEDDATQARCAEIEIFLRTNGQTVLLRYNPMDELLIWEWPPELTGIDARILVDKLINYLLTEHHNNLLIWDVPPVIE